MEKTDSGIKPWRLPYDKLKLFYPGLAKTGSTSGKGMLFVCQLVKQDEKNRNLSASKR